MGFFGGGDFCAFVGTGDFEPVDRELHFVDGALDGAAGDFVFEAPRFAPGSKALFGAPDEGDIFGLKNDFAVGVEVGEDLGFEVRAGWGHSWLLIRVRSLLSLSVRHSL